jgi:hypothetical protein
VENCIVTPELEEEKITKNFCNVRAPKGWEEGRRMF